jgi:hypothetical protein
LYGREQDAQNRYETWEILSDSLTEWPLIFLDTGSVEGEERCATEAQEE